MTVLRLTLVVRFARSHLLNADIDGQVVKDKLISSRSKYCVEMNSTTSYVDFRDTLHVVTS